VPPRWPFLWNAQALRYVDAATGRFVSRLQVRAAIDAALDSAGRRMQAATIALQRKAVSVERWRLEMRREIKNVHLYSAAAARGGWAEFTQAELGRVGYIVGDQYAYLDRFARDLQAGRVPRDGRILSRVQMYAQAGRRTYHVTDARIHLEHGYSEERNIVMAGEACTGCQDEEARDWVPIGELVPIGLRPCLSRCRCTVEYR
jgi:hypothetical protein